jgi:hypothetical protein
VRPLSAERRIASAKRAATASKYSKALCLITFEARFTALQARFSTNC